MKTDKLYVVSTCASTDYTLRGIVQAPTTFNFGNVIDFTRGQLKIEMLVSTALCRDLYKFNYQLYVMETFTNTIYTL